MLTTFMIAILLWEFIPLFLLNPFDLPASQFIKTGEAVAIFHLRPKDHMYDTSKTDVPWHQTERRKKFSAPLIFSGQGVFLLDPTWAVDNSPPKRRRIASPFSRPWDIFVQPTAAWILNVYCSGKT